MSMKTLISSAALIAGMATIAPAATAADWSLSADFVGEYVFRGFTLGAEAVQTGAEVSLENGLTFGVWGSLGVGEQSIFTGDEVDLYVGYSVPVSDTFSLDLGATIYHYPQLGDVLSFGDFSDPDDASTLEFSAGTSFGGTLDPSVTVYYDTSLDNITLEGGAGYSFPAGPSSSIDLGASLGYVALGDDSTGYGTDIFDSYTYGSASAAYSYAFSDAASGYIGINAGASSEDTFADVSPSLTNASFGSAETSSVWYSIGLSTGF